MSELGKERIMQNCNGMSEEEVKVFLTQVDKKLLVGELDRRLEEAEKRDSILSELVSSYEKRDDWK